MSDTAGKFPRSAGQDGGDAVGDREGHTSKNSAGPPAVDADWLDSDHHARLARVAACDSARTRGHAAETEIARLIEEEQMLGAELLALGGDEHVDAIVHSGWFPYASGIVASARLAWILDAVLWTALWLSVWALAVRVLSHD